MADIVAPDATIWAGCILPFIKKIFVAGPGAAPWAALLDALGCVPSVDGQEPEPPPYEGVILDASGMAEADIEEWIQAHKALLAPTGWLHVQVDHSGHPDVPDGAGMAPEPLDALLRKTGFRRYFRGTYPLQGPPRQYFAIAVPMDYDPALHARALFKEGRLDGCLSLLENIPSEVLDEDMLLKARVLTEHQLARLALARRVGPAERLRQFMLARRDFQTSVFIYPNLQEPYCFHAQFWHDIGDDDMARRTLTSIHAINPSDSMAYLIGAFSAPYCHDQEEEPPAFQLTSRPPRLLCLLPPEPDPGSDVLYDGCCRVLGAQQVVEYPWKPCLHGIQDSNSTERFCFNLPGEAWPLEKIETALRAGEFDYIFFMDMHLQGDREALLRIMKAAGQTPLFLIDLANDCSNLRGPAIAYLGNPEHYAYFKREMLSCYDYGPNSFPLPLSYPESMLPDQLPEPSERHIPLFWSGNRSCGMRRLLLERLEAVYGIDLNAPQTPAQYREHLLHARMGLSLLGAGFDTFRFWETPLYGALLLAERPPIRTLYPFCDGENAVFFDDFPDLDDKLGYYLAHEAETQRIAEAGRLHALQYHTAAARSRQLLGTVQSLCAS